MKLKEVGKTTRPFRYDINQIPYDYTVEVRNRFKGLDLDYCDTEWFALETNRDHSAVFKTASKYCISDSFVDYDGYSISPEILAHSSR